MIILAFLDLGALQSIQASSLDQTAVREADLRNMCSKWQASCHSSQRHCLHWSSRPVTGCWLSTGRVSISGRFTIRTSTLESTSNPDKQRCSPNACYPDPASALAQCAQYMARYGGVMGELWAAEVQPLDEDSRTSLWPSSTFDSSRLLAHYS